MVVELIVPKTEHGFAVIDQGDKSGLGLGFRVVVSSVLDFRFALKLFILILELFVGVFGVFATSHFDEIVCRVT